MKWILLATGMIIIIIWLVFLFNKPQPSLQNTPSSSLTVSTPSPTETINYKAAFAIFTNGTFRIFTDSKYHNKSSEVFIDSSDPNIIQVKKKGVTYNDFFKTLPMSLTKKCLVTGTKQTFCSGPNETLKFFLNGAKTDDALDMEINNGDKLLITFGNENNESIKVQMQKIPNP